MVEEIVHSLLTLELGMEGLLALKVPVLLFGRLEGGYNFVIDIHGTLPY